MGAETRIAPAAAGRLTGLQRGVLSGELVIDAALQRHERLTVEVFVHGILAASTVLEPVPGPGLLAFSLPLGQLPLVSLPCTLTARLRETDRALESGVTLADLADLWARMMPFSARVETVSHRQVLIRTTGMPAPGADLFELRETGDLLAVSEPGGRDAEGGLFVITLPERLLDGSEHRLFVRHRGSGLPLQGEPLCLRLDLRRGPQPDLQELVRRIDALEQSLRQRYAEAFNGLAAPLYRHVDALAQTQRVNFEREIAALRRLLALEPDLPTPDLPAEAMLPFDGPLTGYGLHGVEQSGTGKGFRPVAASCGFLLPAIAPGPALLHVQGLRRPHPAALEGARLGVNGQDVPVTTYLSSRSESWNLRARLAGPELRPDRNLIELRLPQGLPEGAEPAGPGALEKTVGILFVSLTRPAADPAAAEPADG